MTFCIIQYEISYYIILSNSTKCLENMVKSPPAKQRQKLRKFLTRQCPLLSTTHTFAHECLLILTYAQTPNSSEGAQVKVHLFSQKYWLNVWCGPSTARHRGHIMKMTIIGPLPRILCRDEKSIWRAESGTFWGC